MIDLASPQRHIQYHSTHSHAHSHGALTHSHSHTHSHTHGHPVPVENDGVKVPETNTMINFRLFDTAQRKKLADKGYALPDGSFPIANVSDLENAIHAVGRASNPEAAKRHIIKRAKALGATDKIPQDWQVNASVYLRYSGVADLPPAVKDAYDSHCQEVFLRVFNKAFYAKAPESQAFAMAHAAAKNCQSS